MNTNRYIFFKSFFCYPIKRLLILLLTVFLAIVFILPSLHSVSAVEKQIVRVGFFPFDGYHEIDKNSKRSGYGYEYLHEMSKYTNWKFEYIDATWNEAQKMLENGEIDILTSAQFTDARAKVFDFSDTAIGTSYAQLTVKNGNSKYIRNDFSSFDGIKIGLLNGNSRNNDLESFAIEKGFTFKSTMYDTQIQLEEALHNDEIDAILTSSLRKLHSERIIAQFDPSLFYVIVKKGNTQLMQEINDALELIEMNNPAFKHNLYQKHYREGIGESFIMSREELAYVKSAPKLRAVIRGGIPPVSSLVDGEYSGIAADIFNQLLSELNADITYITPDTLEDGYKMLSDGSADIVCMFESDYDLAEMYNTKVTSSFLDLNYSIITKISPRNQQNKIAALEGDIFSTKYAQTHYPNTEILYFSTAHDAIDAVSKGDAYMGIVNVYSGESELLYFNDLHSTLISSASQSFSVGISQLADSRLYSILDKRIQSLTKNDINEILSNHTMLTKDSLSVLAYFRQNPLLPFLIVVIFFALIIFILSYVIIINRIHSKKIFNLAYIDSSTQLWNTNGLIYKGDRILENRSKDVFAVIDLGLSGFEKTNEVYGRGVSEKIIVSMAEILKGLENEHTIVAHCQLDNFLILTGVDNLNQLDDIFDKISLLLSRYYIGDIFLTFDMLIGVAPIEKDFQSLQSIIDHARIAKTEAFFAGGGVIFWDDKLKKNLLREQQILDYITLAIETDELLVYYQPKVDMLCEKYIGAEALIRWNHKTLGFLSPAEFVPILEHSGAIIEVDFYVLDKACALVRKWIDNDIRPIIISVNQSRANFSRPDYIPRIQAILDKYSIPNGIIELEITETLFGQEVISNKLTASLKKLGVLISIDDFGSGYSSLYLLHQISVDILKIDKCLLDESFKSLKVKNIIHRVVQIAHDLDLEVICEGVETKEQAEFLINIGCKYAQGYLYSKPLPLEDFEIAFQKQYK